MSRYATVAIGVINTTVWFALVGWVMLVAFYWTVSNPTNGIHQAVYAAQCAALSVMGYAVARGLTEVVKLVASAVAAIVSAYCERNHHVD